MPRKRPTDTPPVSTAIFQDPDLVDRIFDYLLSEFPHIAGERFNQAKRAVRDEFRGEEVYIAARASTERQRLVQEVLSMFNGRNASEVARRLRISRASVYRFLKQSGRRSTSNSLTFPGNETSYPVGSRQDPPAAPAAGSVNPED
jgi:DNA-binding phage protein